MFITSYKLYMISKINKKTSILFFQYIQKIQKISPKIQLDKLKNLIFYSINIQF